MNVPAIAKKTFLESKANPELMEIVHSTLEKLKGMPSPIERARFVHAEIERFNKEIFSHPLVQKLSPCKMGCTACCHTQVSVSHDEATLLAQHVREGLSIDQDLLQKQMDAGNEEDGYYRLSYGERRCVFLDEKGACRIYHDRPSVCRTNAVIGDALQCDSTTKPGQMTLVRTPKADLVIYAFYLFNSGGVLPYLVGKELGLIVAE